MRDAPSLLLVDDDRTSRHITRVRATAKGFCIITTSTAREASILIAQQPSFDLILAALSLPDGSGWDVIGRLDTTHDAGIVVVTGAPDIDAAIAAIRLRVDDYMVKPLDNERLDTWFDRASQRARRRLAGNAQRSNQAGGRHRTTPEHRRSCPIWHPRTLEDIERQAIEQTLRHCGNDKTLAAKILGISTKTIYNKLVRYKHLGVG